MSTITKNSSESAKNIYDELKSHRVMVVATQDKQGKPDLSVLYYKLFDDFSVGIGTKKGTAKHKNLQINNRVEFIVYEEARQITIKYSGIAERVTDHKTEVEIVEQLHKSSNHGEIKPPPITKLEAGDFVTYLIRPTKITMAIFTRPEGGGYDIFETLAF